MVVRAGGGKGTICVQQGKGGGGKGWQINAKAPSTPAVARKDAQPATTVTQGCAARKRTVKSTGVTVDCYE